MGLSWCPRDPELIIRMQNGEEHILRAYFLVPAEYADDPGRMRFQFTFPAGMNHIPYLTTFDEDDERLVFQYDPGLTFGEDWMTVHIAASAPAVPVNEPARLLLVLPWQGEISRIDGHAKGIHQHVRIG